MQVDMKKRSPALDVIRCFALLCVICVHFFRNTDLYAVTINGKVLLGMISLRSFFMICVPLFLMLSGYLLKNKRLGKAYYFKLVQTIGIYLLASVACGVYKVLFASEPISIGAAVRGLFSFSTAGYGWYVEMYLGLFLLIPFLNMMYEGAKTQKNRKLLVCSLLILTALPSILNIWKLLPLSWWLRPSSSQSYDYLVPDYWIMIFPITYYVIGAYLRDYPLRLKRSVNLLLILLVFAVGGLFNYYRSYGTFFVGGEWSDYRSILVVVQSVLVFHFLNGLDYSRVGDKTAAVLGRLSSWTLGAYLCSEIFDGLFYPLITEHVSGMLMRLLYFPLIVPAVYICSLALSAVLNGIYALCARLFRRKKICVQTSGPKHG